MDKVVPIPLMSGYLSVICCRTYAKGEADAQAYYDCILPLLTSLTSNSFGILKTVCILHANTLEAAKYHLKNLFKVSEDHYQHSTLIPIYNNGQCSANSPAVWLFISNVLFKCQRSHGLGAAYADPTNTIKISIYVVG